MNNDNEGNAGSEWIYNPDFTKHLYDGPIFTEEENEARQLNNMMNPQGKSCMNCHWSNADKGDKFTTCGHHLQNFSTNSFCAYWTDPEDPVLKSHISERIRRLGRSL